MKVIEIESSNEGGELGNILKNYANAVIEEKKIEYNCLFNLYKSNKLAEVEQKNLAEYLEYMRSIDGLEFDKDNNLTN